MLRLKLKNKKHYNSYNNKEKKKKETTKLILQDFVQIFHRFKVVDILINSVVKQMNKSNFINFDWDF